MPFPVVDGADVRVGAQGREVLEQVGDLAARGERRGQPVGAAHTRHVPRPGVVGNRLDVAVARQQRGGGLGAEAGQAGEPVGAVPHEREPVGDRFRGHPELLAHAVGVEEHIFTPVELHDLPADALSEVLVGRADDRLLDPPITAGDGRRRGQRVVGLVLHHRPHRDAERLQGRLQERELGEQLGVHAGAGLVVIPEVVPEGLDHLVGRHAHVGGPALQHRQHRLHDRPGTADLHAARIPVAGPGGEMLAEELVGAVDEVHTHGPSLAHVAPVTPRA